MDRKTFALYTIIIGALFGILADVLFYGKLLGVSFPIFILIGIVVVLASHSIAKQSLMPQPIRRVNLWVLVPALFFAGMVAIRADRSLTNLNVAVALGLSALSLHYLPLTRRIDLDALGDHVFGTLDAIFSPVVAPLFEVFDSVSWGFDHLHGHWRTVASVGRGLVIAAPVLLVFAVLLASADAVFAGYLSHAMTFMSIFTFQRSQVEQVGIISVIGWLACGTIAYGAARRDTFQHAERENKPKRKRWSLGLIEACIMLGSVDLLFALFVLIQFTYFFGGRAALSAANISYSDYARHGFFELVAVSVLTLVLVLALDRITMRRAARHNRLFRALAVVLVALTGVLLVSASQRMLLYEEQFGFTTLRVYTHVFMLWLGVLFAFFLLALFRVRMRIFSLGVLLVMIGYVGTLNLMNVEGYIAERNIARAEQGSTVDFYYLNSFSVDAVPAVLHHFESPLSPELHAALGQWLAGKLIQLDQSRLTEGSSVFSTNLARSTAWAELDAIRDQLPEYDPLYFYRGDWLSNSQD
ncbi:MAG: DUF4173 domain-containing protein [Chloroflexota bacterium]